MGDVDNNLGSQLETQVRRWRDDLINLTRVNRLLYYRPTRSASIGIVAPAIDRIFTVLDAGRHLSFWEPPAELTDDQSEQIPGRKSDELETDKPDAVSLDRGLRALESKVLAIFNERGLWTMHLGLGMLNWDDPVDHRQVSAPLLLLPVAFNRATLREQFRVWRTEEDAVVNPALLVKLQIDFGIDIDVDADQGPEMVCRAIEARVASNGWTVQRHAVLDAFSFQKEAMYRDVRDNEATIVSAPHRPARWTRSRRATSDWDACVRADKRP